MHHNIASRAILIKQREQLLGTHSGKKSDPTYLQEFEKEFCKIEQQGQVNRRNVNSNGVGNTIRHSYKNI